MHELGLSLKQCAVRGDEAKAALKWLGGLAGLAGSPFFSAAAFAERPWVATILDKGGMYLCDRPDNLSDITAKAEWAFSLPRCEQDRFFQDSEVRCGELWLREIETRPATPELTTCPARQFIRCSRTLIKATGEIRFEID